MPRPPEYGAGRLQKRPEGPEKDRNMLAQRKRATTAAMAAVIALLAVIAYQGAAAAQGQPPPAPQNPMAHLIAGDGQDPQVRVSWEEARARLFAHHGCPVHPQLDVFRSSCPLTGGQPRPYDNYIKWPGGASTPQAMAPPEGLR